MELNLHSKGSQDVTFNKAEGQICPYYLHHYKYVHRPHVYQPLVKKYTSREAMYVQHK